ncbi:MAG TPA: sensor histidine kinase [Methylophilaceae bacterium]|nr:sensor histidine kinase [Methylophilaceae bacterium]HAJ70689.1 sensor histidine kinase [Methylophilaceae bacterium]
MSLKLRLNIMITCLLLIVLIIGAWFMLLNARENVRAEIESTASLTLHLLDREILSFSETPIGGPEVMPFQLANLSHIRHLRIEFFDTAGKLRDTNQLPKTTDNQSISPKWFVRLMTVMSPMEFTSRVVIFGGKPVGQLVITPDPSYEIEEIWDDTKDLLALVFIFFIAVNMLVYGAIDRALKPVNSILAALTDLEHGKLDTRLPAFELPELASIGTKFNGMAETLELSIKRNLGLSRQIISLEEVERKSLARDLHDEIGQSITAIHIDAQAILNISEFNQMSIDNLRISAQAIINVTKKMMGITHQILERLRPDTIDKLGLKTALEDLVSSWQPKLGKAICSLNISGELEGVAETVAITAYRVIQESMTNIARYAQAERVSIGILQEDEVLVLMVEDDGLGFNTEDMTNGFGLTGMRERVEGLGGEFELDSAINKGTRLVVRLPLLG